MARVLVVGGAGYVGGWLTDQLIQVGHEVVVYDLLLYEDFYLKPISLVHGDVLNRELLTKALEGVDAVVWLAALVGDPACALDAGMTERINVGSVKWLAEHFDGRIVFMSTCSVYGAQDGELSEDSPLNPLSLYAQTKLEAEKSLADRNAIVFRLGTLYGVGDTYSRLRTDLVVNTLTIRATVHGRMSVFGGRQYRPLLHVRDVASAVVPAIETDDRGIFNLHDENLTILEIAERVQSHVPDAQLEVTELKFQDARNYRVSGQLVRDVLGFAPRYSVDDGIHQIQALIEEGRVRDLSSARFSNVESLRPYLVPEVSPLGSEVHVAHQLTRRRAP
ncbi:MAG: SDR family oxidoreductase [Acidimicrobiia bacterium]